MEPFARRSSVSLLFAATCATGLGCATAVTDSFEARSDASTRDSRAAAFDTAPDPTKSPRPDTAVAPDDTATPEDPPDAESDASSGSDAGSFDDTLASSETTFFDVGGDGAPTGNVLVYSDAPATLADDAVSAIGGTPLLANAATFATLFDAKGFDVLVVDSAYELSPAGMDTRVASWVTGGGRVVFAYWNLNGSPTLSSALEVSAETYNVWRDVHRDPTTTVDLFSGKESFPSPLSGAVAGILDNGDALTATGAGGIIAAHLDSPTGPGAIAITRGGKAIVNGFAPWDAQATDADGDGIADMRELWENELAYVNAH
jgi:hypothetical protein